MKRDSRITVVASISILLQQLIFHPEFYSKENKANIFASIMLGINVMVFSGNKMIDEIEKREKELKAKHNAENIFETDLKGQSSMSLAELIKQVDLSKEKN
ncbi:hypothetical protein LCGC14_1683210 [marine sediment metagenome]|uniref:Uncharacterized protein n=1 Tax=marine sediment metagenome TaxID=412755 RepID=A0A0F9HN36_9ZZZZ|nr:hypothetical protein [Candidatus Scalindua sp.]